MTATPLAYLRAALDAADRTVERLRNELWWVGNVTRIEAWAGDIKFEDPRVDGRTVTVTEAIQRGLLAGSPEDLSRRIAADRKLIAECEKVLAVDGWEYDDAPKLAEHVISNLSAGWGWTGETG